MGIIMFVLGAFTVTQEWNEHLDVIVSATGTEEAPHMCWWVQYIALFKFHFTLVSINPAKTCSDSWALVLLDEDIYATSFKSLLISKNVLLNLTYK